MTASTLRAALALGLASLLSSCSALAWFDSGPSVHDHDLEVWQAYVEADADESRWLEIPWIPTLAGGLRAADGADKPVLLWVMNGHPLGCT